MRRREFIKLLSSAAVAWPFGALAQKIGFLSGLDKAGAGSFISAFREGLQCGNAIKGGIREESIHLVSCEPQSQKFS